MTRPPNGLRYPLASTGGDNWQARAEAAEAEAARLAAANQRLGSLGRVVERERDEYFNAKEAAEKEVERERLWKREANTKLSIAEAKLAALVEALKPFAAMAGKPLKITAIDGGSLFVSVDTNDFERAAQALSALPPPAAEEGGELKSCPFCAIQLKAELGSDPWWTHPVNGCVIGGKSIFPEDVAAWNTRPTQAPQDVAGLVEEIPHV